MIMFPLLTVVAGFLSLYGGFLASVLTGILKSDEYIYGIRYQFESENVLFALLKALIFGFLITSISAYQGYITKGGSLEVGKASTNAVTNSCIAVLIADYVVAQLLMS